MMKLALVTAAVLVVAGCTGMGKMSDPQMKPMTSPNGPSSTSSSPTVPAAETKGK
jgi:hypothetical protein